MANMSYCRFENTSIDLRDCVNALEEGDYPESDYEKQAAKCMIDLCKRYVQAYEKIDLDEQDV